MPNCRERGDIYPFLLSFRGKGRVSNWIFFFFEKTPQVHLIIIRKWPKTTSPSILRNLIISLPGHFIWQTPQSPKKRLQNLDKYINHFDVFLRSWLASSFVLHQQISCYSVDICLFVCLRNLFNVDISVTM